MSWPTDQVQRSGPLAGLRVLDMSRILAGPFSAQILADLGADVIKVERPGAGDETRRWGPPFTESGDAAYFFACNRGRRSITIDLRDEDDRGLVLELVRGAHVLLENFLPGTMERMGLDEEILRGANPSLVHAVISGYGSGSSRERWPALDFVVQAHVGVLSVTGPDPETGVKAGVPIADLSAGLYATIGILAAVRRAEASGEGGRVEVSLAEACASLFTNQAMNYLIGGLEPRALGNTHPNIAPYQVVQAGDKRMTVAASSEVQFERLCRVVGLPELSSDPRFQTNPDRVANRAELETLLEQRLAERSAEEWVRELNQAGVAAAVINTVPEMFSEPDTTRSLIARLPDGTPQIRTPIRVDGNPLPLSGPPPRLGEHDGQIRAALEIPNGRAA